MKDKELARFRSEMYKALSACFCFPDQLFFRYARSDLQRDLDKSLGALPYSAAIKHHYEQFIVSLAETLDGFSLEDLQIAYTGLFIYAQGAHCCFPYESMWIKGSRRLMGDSTMTVKRLYRSFKLRISPQFRDLPDHISAELEFMRFLSHSEGMFAASRNAKYRNFFIENEKGFLENHLLSWIPKFSNYVKENSDFGFFTTLCQLTEGFLIAEAIYLKHTKKDNKNSSSDGEIDTMNFDVPSLKVLESAEGLAPDPEVKWIYNTSPEKYWYSPVKAKVVDGRAEQMVARDDVPFFNGKQDVRAFACFAKLYAPDKLKFPLKRVGKRGEGKFKRISWDEALEEIARVLKKYRDQGCAKYVGFLRTHPPLENMFNHFAHHYGSPNDVHTSTTSCYADSKVAAALTGSDLGEDDYLNSKYSLYIGHNLPCGVREIQQAARFAEAIRKGMRFVFVDPRLNEGSYTYGAEWLSIKPGTDAAFVLALINVIIRERLYDEEFLLKYTNAPTLIKSDGYPLKNKAGEYLVWDVSVGNVVPLDKALNPNLLGKHEINLDTYRGVCHTAFQLLEEQVEGYTPENAARITTIRKEKVEEIARDLGTMKPQVTIFGHDAVSAQYSNSMQYCRARNVLMCLVGIFDKPGGKYYGPYEPNGITLNKGEDFRIPIEVHPMTKDRVDFDPSVHPCINTEMKDYPIGVVQNILSAIKTGKPYPIKTLFIIGSDVLASHSSEWKEAFKKVDFIVKSHVWPDDDVDYADIVLPEAAYLERDDGFAEVTTYDPDNKEKEFSFLTIIQKAVEPQFEERPWTDYIKELAQRIGFGECYDFTLDEYWNFLLEPMGITIDYLRKHGVYYPTPLVTTEIQFGKKKKWNTDTGRLNIYSCEMVDLWHKKNHDSRFDPLPAYHPITIEPKEDNEFYLINGKISYFKCNFYRNNAMLLEKYLEGELGSTLLWINAKKAASLGIRDRDWVWVESKATGLKDRVKVKVTEGIHPSAVWHAYGYGRRSKLMDKLSRGREGINVEDFIPEHYVPLTAGQAHCEAVVKVYKA